MNLMDARKKGKNLEKVHRSFKKEYNEGKAGVPVMEPIYDDEEVTEERSRHRRVSVTKSKTKKKLLKKKHREDYYPAEKVKDLTKGIMVSSDEN